MKKFENTETALAYLGADAFPNDQIDVELETGETGFTSGCYGLKRGDTITLQKHGSIDFISGIVKNIIA